jgi:hypothetical protein
MGWAWLGGEWFRVKRARRIVGGRKWGFMMNFF